MDAGGCTHPGSETMQERKFVHVFAMPLKLQSACSTCNGQIDAFGNAWAWTYSAGDDDSAHHHKVFQSIIATMNFVSLCWSPFWRA